jgi:hypothetical protein
MSLVKICSTKFGPDKAIGALPASLPDPPCTCILIINLVAYTNC